MLMADTNREEVILRLIEALQEAEISLEDAEADSSDDFGLALELVQQLQEELQTLLQ
jgi:TorA maturation chaperone TorD